MKKIAVIDIDGTVSKVGDRLKYLQQDKKDWDAFYAACEEDEPIVLGMICAFKKATLRSVKESTNNRFIIVIFSQ